MGCCISVTAQAEAAGADRALLGNQTEERQDSHSGKNNKRAAGSAEPLTNQRLRPAGLSGEAVSWSQGLREGLPGHHSREQLTCSPIRPPIHLSVHPSIPSSVTPSSPLSLNIRSTIISPFQTHTHTLPSSSFISPLLSLPHILRASLPFFIHLHIFLLLFHPAPPPHTSFFLSLSLALLWLKEHSSPFGLFSSLLFLSPDGDECDVHLGRRRDGKEKKKKMKSSKRHL